MVFNRTRHLHVVIFAFALCLALGLTGQAYADPLDEGGLALDVETIELTEGVDVPGVPGVPGVPEAVVSEPATDEVEGEAPDALAPSEGIAEEPVQELVAQGPGSGAIADGVYTISSSISDSARVEIGGASQDNGAATNIYEDNWTAAQRWYVTALGDGLYKIANVASGKCLDVSGGEAYSGARVQQYTDNGTKAQQWAIEDTGSGYKLYSALSSEYVLDLASANTKSGTSVRLYKSNDTNAQRWNLTAIEPVVPDGVYVAAVKSSGQVLDVASGSVDSGANVQQYTSNGTLAQSFCLSFNPQNGYYTIIGAASGLVFDVSGGANSNGANVQMYTPNGTKAQQWAIEKNSDGTYTVHSAIGGRVLDVSGASLEKGANVQTYASNGTPAQKWTFTGGAAWSLPDGVYNIVTALNKANSLAVASASRDASGNVQTASRQEDKWSQKWVIAQAAGGYYTVRNLNSRMMLDIEYASTEPRTNVQQYTQNGTDAQLWKLELTAGGIVFRSKLDSSIVLDISGGSTAVGANLQVYKDNGTVAQKFRVRSVSAIDDETAFTFVNLESGLVIDVTSASKENGAVVQLHGANGTVAQKFRALSAGGNTYYLKNMNSEKFIAVDTGADPGVLQYEGQSGADKQWEIVLDIATGSFTLKSVHTGTYLDGTAGAGALSLAPGSSTEAQLFALQPLTFKVFLDAGHIVGQGGYDSGAVGNGYTEAQLTSDLTDRIYKICVEEYGLDVVDGKTFGISYEKRTGKAYELGCTALVSIHFNAGGGSGSMTIVGGSSRRNADSPELADIMHEYLVEGMGPDMDDYGVVTRGDLAIPNDSRIAATLLEIAFIDNSYDMQVYDSRRDDVARSLAKGIYEASLRAAFNG